MTRHFIDVIKNFIRTKGLQDLTSDGWSRMRQVERDVTSGKIKSADEAVQIFLRERDFGYTISKDRNAMQELKKIIERD